MAGVITAWEPSWIAPFTGLSPRAFGKLVTVLRREGAAAVRKGRPWSFMLGTSAGQRRDRAVSAGVPPAGFEPAHTAPEDMIRCQADPALTCTHDV